MSTCFAEPNSETIYYSQYLKPEIELKKARLSSFLHSSTCYQGDFSIILVDKSGLERGEVFTNMKWSNFLTRVLGILETNNILRKVVHLNNFVLALIGSSSKHLKDILAFENMYINIYSAVRM